MRPILLGTLLLTAVALAAPSAPPAYHLQLEANPAAPFPFLGKFGTVAIDVYPKGLRAETLWLNGFSVNDSQTLRVENPLGRTYTDLPISQLGTMMKKLASGAPLVDGVPNVQPPASGTVRGLAASRYRLEYGPTAWIDIWTTRAVPENPQFRRLMNEVTRTISPATAAAANNIPGTPIYVELNFRRFHKLPLLRMKSLVMNAEGEADALRTGALYFKAPFLDALTK
jgi:hypothetical protein